MPWYVRVVLYLWLEWRRRRQSAAEPRQGTALPAYAKTEVFRIWHPTVVWGTLSLPRMSLGLIPARAPMHVWPGNSLSMFDSKLVLVETYSAESSVTQPREIALYAKAFDLLTRSAVYGQPARALIAKALARLDV